MVVYSQIYKTTKWPTQAVNLSGGAIYQQGNVNIT